MRRFQLFEINDQTWLPNSVRDALTDYLQFVTFRAQPYAPIVPRLERALEQAEARQIVDLCSGGAGPWLSLYPILRQVIQPPPVNSTDAKARTIFLRSRGEIDFRSNLRVLV